MQTFLHNPPQAGTAQSHEVQELRTTERKRIATRPDTGDWHVSHRLRRPTVRLRTLRCPPFRRAESTNHRQPVLAPILVTATARGKASRCPPVSTLGGPYLRQSDTQADVDYSAKALGNPDRDAHFAAQSQGHLLPLPRPRHDTGVVGRQRFGCGLMRPPFMLDQESVGRRETDRRASREPSVLSLREPPQP